MLKIYAKRCLFNKYNNLPVVKGIFFTNLSTAAVDVFFDRFTMPGDTIGRGLDLHGVYTA